MLMLYASFLSLSEGAVAWPSGTIGNHFGSTRVARAKAEVAALIDKLGLFGIDLGSLAVGARLFPAAQFPVHNLVTFD